MKIENFTSLGSQELLETNGGGFAFDAGRVIRFISLMGYKGIFTPYAIADWQINAMDE